MTISKEHFEHLKEVNRTFYDQTKLADQKAAYIFTFMIALLVWSSEMKKVFSFAHYSEIPFWQGLISAIVAVSLVTCLAAAILVVIPRNRGGGTSLFWASWDAAEARLTAAERSDDVDMLAEEYKGNIRNLAAICREKYRYASVALRALGIAVVGHLGLLVFT